MAIESALIVDDSKLARITLRKKLQRHGVEADVAESASEALEKLKAHRPQIVFMDHLMPGMDGFEATKVIRGMPGMADLPIVMCTGKDHEGYLAEAQSIGANSTLTKPPTEDSLTSILSTDFTLLFNPSAADLADINAGRESVGRTMESNAEAVDPIGTPIVIGESAEIDVEASFENVTISTLDASDKNFGDESLDDLLSGLLGDMGEDTPTIDAAPEVTLDDTLIQGDGDVSVEATPAFAEETVVEQVKIAELVRVEVESVRGTMMQSIETVMASSLNEAMSKLSERIREEVREDAANNIAAAEPALTPEAINKLMLQKMQLLWKKTNIAINDNVALLKRDIEAQEGNLVQQFDEKLSALHHQSAAGDEGDLLADNLEEQVRALQIELLETKSSVRTAKVVGFLGFVSGVAAVGYLAARFLGYL